MINYTRVYDYGIVTTFIWVALHGTSFFFFFLNPYTQRMKATFLELSGYFINVYIVRLLSNHP